MEIKKLKINLDQRYFYFVGLNVEKQFDIEELWEMVSGKSLDKQYDEEIQFETFNIFKRRIIWEEGLLKSRDDELKFKNPNKKNNDMLFGYDMIIVKFNDNIEESLQKIKNQNQGDSEKKWKVILLGFPFVSLAKKVLKRITSDEENNITQKCSFVYPNLTKFSKKTLNNSIFEKDTFVSQISGLGIGPTPDDKLSKILLRGKEPLDSKFYKDNIKSSIENEDFVFEDCIVSCFVNQEIKNDDDGIDLKSISNAKIHIDQFGNFKFYVHAQAKNVFIIKPLINIIIELDCLNTTSSNPLAKIIDKDDGKDDID